MSNVYETKNYMKPGGKELVIGGKLTIEGGLMPNQAASSATSIADIKTAFNDLLIKLKNAGLMAGDTMTVAVAAATASADPHENRAYNTGKVAAVAIADNVITITLTEGTKVEDLKDFDGGNGWGVHKWLGIGVSGGVTPITGLSYNGSALTEADIDEATNQAGLSAGYFVRWVAADLVKDFDNTQRTKNYFELSADGMAKTRVEIRIVEG